MIVEYIRYQIPEEEARSFEDAYCSADASLEASLHCQRYEVARRTEDPAAYKVRTEWGLGRWTPTGFRARPEFGSFFAAVRPYADRIDEMRHYAVKTAGAK
jgi:hypothetical protein